MPLSLGIKLVIIIPSFLFLVGFGFKGIIEKSHLDNLFEFESEKWMEMFREFNYLFSFESLFLVIANGLIIMFELENIELGIILILVGLIISSAISICAHTKQDFLGGLAFGYGMGLWGCLNSFKSKEWAEVPCKIVSAADSVIGISS